MPIEGLYFLDGDIILAFLELKYGAVETPFFNPAGLKAQKRAQVEFRSGLSLDISEDSAVQGVALIRLFSEMTLPYFDDRDHAFSFAKDIAEQVGYVALRKGENQLQVSGQEPGEQFLITYDNELRRMVDVVKANDEAFSQNREPLLDHVSRMRLPKLYANEHLGVEALAQVKFFTPSSHWTWYASEASAVMKDGSYQALAEVDPNDPQVEDIIFFGLVDGFELEFGYFSLAELENIGGGLTLPIARDRHFTPTSLKTLQDNHHR